MTVTTAILVILLAAVTAALIFSVVVNNGLGRQVEDLTEDRTILHGAVAEARQTFTRYATLHNAKNTDEGDAKARANGAIAQRMDKALKATEYVELGPLQQTFANFARQANELHNRVPADSAWQPPESR